MVKKYSEFITEGRSEYIMSRLALGFALEVKRKLEDGSFARDCKVENGIAYYEYDSIYEPDAMTRHNGDFVLMVLPDNQNPQFLAGYVSHDTPIDKISFRNVNALDLNDGELADLRSRVSVNMAGNGVRMLIIKARIDDEKRTEIPPVRIVPTRACGLALHKLPEW